MEENTKNTQEDITSELEENFFLDSADQDQAKIDEAINNSTPLTASALGIFEGEPFKTFEEFKKLKAQIFGKCKVEATNLISKEKNEKEITIKFGYDTEIFEPIVVCEENQKCKSFSWQILIKTAIKNGLIDELLSEVKNGDSKA